MDRDQIFSIFGKFVFYGLIVAILASSGYNYWYSQKKVTPAVIGISNSLQNLTNQYAKFRLYALPSIEAYEAKQARKKKR